MSTPNLPDPNPATPPATPPAPTPPAQNGPPAGYVSQEEVNRIAAREKDQGRNAALTELQNQLGVDLDTAKAILKQHKDNEDSQKSEAQKAREAADAEKATAEKEKSEAQKAAHTANVTTEFVLAGITDRTKIERYSRMLDVEVGAKPDAITKAIEKLKTEEPALFGAQQGDGNPPPRRTPPSDPKGSPPPPANNSDAFQRGMQRAASHGRGFGWQAPATAQQ